MPLLPNSVSTTWDMTTAAGYAAATPRANFQRGERDDAPTNFAAESTSGSTSVAIGPNVISAYISSKNTKIGTHPTAGYRGGMFAINYKYSAPPLLFSAAYPSSAVLYQVYAVNPQANSTNSDGTWPYFDMAIGGYFQSQYTDGTLGTFSLSCKMFDNRASPILEHGPSNDSATDYVITYPFDDYNNGIVHTPYQTGGYVVSAGGTNYGVARTQWTTPGVPDTAHLFQFYIDRACVTRWLLDINTYRASIGLVKMFKTDAASIAAVTVTSNFMNSEMAGYVYLGTQQTFNYGVCIYAPTVLEFSAVGGTVVRTIAGYPSWTLSNLVYQDTKYLYGQSSFPSTPPNDTWVPVIRYCNDPTNDLDLLRPIF